MAINIYHYDDFEKIEFICEDQWNLPSQLHDLINWVRVNSQIIENKHIVADIGFQIREDASGGGAVLESKDIKLLAQYNIDIYFSEYQTD